MAGRRLQAVTFDVGNTLLHANPPPPVLYAQALSRLGRQVDAEEVGPVFANAWSDMQRRVPPGQDRYGSLPGGERAWWGALLQEILRRLEHDAPWEELLDELYAAFSRGEAWEVYPDVLPTLEGLRSDGVLLGVVSNWDHRLPALLSQLRLDVHFQTVCVSSLEGVEKPALEIFHRALGRLEVSPELALHVGDSPVEDYHGARAAGMSALLVDRRRLFAGEGFDRVESLAAVRELVSG